MNPGLNLESVFFLVLYFFVLASLLKQKAGEKHGKLMLPGGPVGKKASSVWREIRNGEETDSSNATQEEKDFPVSISCLNFLLPKPIR